MTPIVLIARREIGTFVNTYWGWAIFALILLIDGLLFNAMALGDTARYSADVLEKFFEYSSGTTMVAGILLAMRTLAAEREAGTMVVLQSAPITETQVILGKFLGAFGFLALITICTLYMPALILVNGKVSWGEVGAGYLGLLLLGAATVAIGTFASSVSKNQFMAGVVGAVILVAMLLGWLLGKVTDAPVSDVLSFVALWDRHFQPFMRGRINSESLVFLTSVSFGFLLLATRVLQARRWR